MKPLNNKHSQENLLWCAEQVGHLVLLLERLRETQHLLNAMAFGMDQDEPMLFCIHASESRWTSRSVAGRPDTVSMHILIQNF